jgi:hypothetical protein
MKNNFVNGLWGTMVALLMLINAGCKKDEGDKPDPLPESYFKLNGNLVDLTNYSIYRAFKVDYNTSYFRYIFYIVDTDYVPPYTGNPSINYPGYAHYFELELIAPKDFVFGTEAYNATVTPWSAEIAGSVTISMDYGDADDNGASLISATNPPVILSGTWEGGSEISIKMEGHEVDDWYTPTKHSFEMKFAGNVIALDD